VSTSERTSFDIAEEKELVYYRDRGFCRACGKRVEYPGECAHIVARSRANANRYGVRLMDAISAVYGTERTRGIRAEETLKILAGNAEALGYQLLNHVDNLALTHHGDCNDAVLISGDPADEHMQKIIQSVADGVSVPKKRKQK